MKSEKGITLTTLVIYMIVMILVISILSIISNFFYANKGYILDSSKNISEYNKFNMFFIEDVKNNKSAEVYEEENKIVFADGTVYSYVHGDTGIYRNKVKICNNIELCNFKKITETTENTNTEKQILKVRMVINGAKIFETENSYVLKYW